MSEPAPKTFPKLFADFMLNDMRGIMRKHKVDDYWDSGVHPHELRILVSFMMGGLLDRKQVRRIVERAIVRHIEQKRGEVDETGF